jgi:steroid delta-isomerase-like uncharacterized protein
VHAAPHNPGIPLEPGTMDTAALIRNYYAAFNHADFEGMVALLGDDIVHDANQGSRHAGKDWFRSFLAHMDRCYSEQVVDLVVLTEAGGTRAAAEFVIEGEYKVTDEGLPPARGQRYRLPVGAFFDVRDGLIRRVTNYYNLQDWIAQVSA